MRRELLDERLKAQLIEAVLSVDLLVSRRDLLFSGIDGRYVQGLRTSDRPKAQVSMDLEDLSRTRFHDGTWPLATWLANARDLAQPHDVVATFDEAIAALRTRVRSGTVAELSPVIWKPARGRGLALFALLLSIASSGAVVWLVARPEPAPELRFVRESKPFHFTDGWGQIPGSEGAALCALSWVDDDTADGSCWVRWHGERWEFRTGGDKNENQCEAICLWVDIAE